MPEMEGAGEEGLHKVPFSTHSLVFLLPHVPSILFLFYTVEGRGKGREEKREERRREKEHRAT